MLPTQIYHMEPNIGLNTDTEAASGNGSVIAVLKNLRTRLAAVQAALAGTLIVADDWHPVEISDVTENSSNKALTVPASSEYMPLAIHVTLTTTATVGNRQLVVELRDASDNVIASTRAAVVQAASLTRKYVFGVGMDRLWSFLDTDYLSTPLPVVKLAAGYDIHVYDKAAVDAAADDMIVRGNVDARSV